MTTNIGIEHDRTALKRVLRTLVAIAGVGRATLPRRLRNAVLRLVRPAEWAARRLIIAAAHGVDPNLPARVSRKPAPKPTPLIVKPGFGTGVVVPRELENCLAGRATRPARLGARQALPILDPLRRSRAGRVRTLPRVSGFGAFAVREATPPPPMPWDLLDAAPVARRLDALARALENLPAEALRFARWQARQARARADFLADRGPAAPTRAQARKTLQKFRWPLRGGEPPASRRCADAGLADVLRHAHRMASYALERRDTS